MSATSSAGEFTVLVTRPIHQAHGLCEQITALGIKAILLPTIAIADVDNQAELHQQIQQLHECDIAIFISPNAVQKAAVMIQHYWPAWPQQVKTAAIGSSTAQALSALNWPVDFCPEQQFNSEGLLALPELQQVSGKKILLFRGEGGRELLATELKQRGAELTEIIVYRRVLPVIDRNAILTQLPNIKVIIVTSNAGLQNLCELVGEAGRELLLSKQLLVISVRMAEFAKQLGFIKTPLLASNATDESIIKVLRKMLDK